MEQDLYSGREQSLVKHFVLERYLSGFSPIIGTWSDCITYVDCFSGPWNARSDKLEDSSPGIAVRQLLQAQQNLLRRSPPKHVRVRCFFIEKNESAYQRLNAALEIFRSSSDIELRTVNRDFGVVVPDILKFVQAVRSNFSFFFIDPTGWADIKMDTIAPLLRVTPGEVLINFMTSHIRRFIEEKRPSMDELFGDSSYRARLEGLSGRAFEDALVEAYTDSIATHGGFKYTSSAVVLKPLQNKPHYHLVYGTRNPKGIDVFKESERSAMKKMEVARAKAHQREREQREGGFLFPAEDMHNPSYYRELRNAALSRLSLRIPVLLQKRKRIPYQVLLAAGLNEPLAWASDLTK